jgi:N-acetylmuramoyl-L-alanine amidase
VRTRRTAAKTGGGTLAGDLLLPRLDANAASPLVMTPCGNRVRLRGRDVEFVRAGTGGALPKSAADVLVVIDPGHGGRATGAMGVDGSAEADRVLVLARAVVSALKPKVGRVVMTRNRDMEAGLPFRVALADALRADAAISVHLNADPDGPLARPGVETYGSVADPQGRRLAGVVYEFERRYLETFPGPWVGDADAGAKYRLGRAGDDYYGLLRRAHVPWVIAESLFMTSRHDLHLLDDARFRAGLAKAIADAAVVFTTTRAPGSGWVPPYPRLPNPPEPPSPPGTPKVCVDPAT